MDRWVWGGLIAWLFLSGCSQPPAPEPKRESRAQRQVFVAAPVLGAGPEVVGQPLQVGDIPRPKPKPKARATPVSAGKPLVSKAPGSKIAPPSGPGYPKSRPTVKSTLPTPEIESADSTEADPNQAPEGEKPIMSAVAEVSGDLRSGGGGSEILYLLLEVSPRDDLPTLYGQLFLALVIDVSGSMSGEALDLASAAAAKVFSESGPGDQGKLIAFATSAQVLIAGERPGQERIREALKRANLGVGTQLARGAQAGVSSLPTGDATTLRHMILVSDGHAVDGEKCLEVCTSAWKSGISVSSVGIGEDCDRSLLKQLADAAKGHYYHIATPADLAKVVVAERKSMQSVVLREVQVVPNLAPGVSMRRAFRIGPIREVAVGPRGIKLGDLHSKKTLQLLLELEVKVAPGNRQKLAQMELLSSNPDGSPRPPQSTQGVWAERLVEKRPLNSRIMGLVDKVYAALSRR